MLARLFPRALTNTYLGSWVAVWLVVPVLIVKTLIGFNFSGLNPFVSVAGILESVDGVPLSSFSAEAADQVISSATAWGMAMFALCLMVWLVLVRYRAGLPAAILVVLIEQLGRMGPGLVRAIGEIATGTPSLGTSTLINLAMAVSLIGGFMLSLVAVRRKT
ncbi:MAG: hypothetical protein ACOYKM_11195 [Caulobacterales bacterium]